jgi:hypothetical protein
LDDMEFDEKDESYFKSCPRCQSSNEESGLVFFSLILLMLFI